MSTTSEETLIQGLLAGDEQCYRTAIRNYQAKMRALAASILGERFADEVVQDAWLSVMRALPGFEGRSSLKTWIMRIVANEAKSRLRREKRHTSLESMLEADPFLEARFDASGHWTRPPEAWAHDDPEGILSSDEMRACLARLMRTMPNMQAAALQLREQQGLAYDDICNILDVSESNVRVLLHRARQRTLSCVEHFQLTGECKVGN